MKALWMILSVLILASPAFAQDVKYTFDKKADFSKYKTYRWEKHPKSIDIDTATLRQLGAAFDAELAKKGLTRTDSPTADIVIVFQAAVGIDEKVEFFQAGWGLEPALDAAWYTSGGHVATTNIEKSVIAVGSINLDMFDATKKQLVWRGIVSKALEAGVSPDKKQKNINSAAAKLISNYPAKKK
jgi:hypothetical protein